MCVRLCFKTWQNSTGDLTWIAQLDRHNVMIYLLFPTEFLEIFSLGLSRRLTFSRQVIHFPEDRWGSSPCGWGGAIKMGSGASQLEEPEEDFIEEETPESVKKPKPKKVSISLFLYISLFLSLSVCQSVSLFSLSLFSVSPSLSMYLCLPHFQFWFLFNMYV